MFAAHGVTLALFARERTGRGQAVDVAMLDSAAALLTYQAAIYFTTGSAPSRMGNRHPTIVPYETFTASDGDFVPAVGNDEQWRRFCEMSGFDDGGRFATNAARVTGYAELKPRLDAHIRRRSRRDWIEQLTAAGVACGSVRDLHEVFTDPQLSARGMVAAIEHSRIGALTLLGNPVKLSATPADVRTAPPTLGQHTIRARSRSTRAATGPQASGTAGICAAGVSRTPNGRSAQAPFTTSRKTMCSGSC